MHLDERDVELFYDLWYSLTYSVNSKHKIVPLLKKPVYGEHVDKEPFLKIRSELWKHPEWIDEYISRDGAHLAEEKIDILISWRTHFITDKFVLLKHLKKYSVLMSTGNEPELFGVIGISEPLEAILPHNCTPCIVETALLPFKGRIIYDSLMVATGVSFGQGFKKSFKVVYNEIKAVKGIIESFDRNEQNKKGTAAKKI